MCLVGLLQPRLSRGPGGADQWEGRWGEERGVSGGSGEAEVDLDVAELADVPERLLERMQIDLGDLVELRERLDRLLDGLDRSAGRAPAREASPGGSVSPGAPAS